VCVIVGRLKISVVFWWPGSKTIWHTVGYCFQLWMNLCGVRLIYIVLEVPSINLFCNYNIEEDVPPNRISIFDLSFFIYMENFKGIHHLSFTKVMQNFHGIVNFAESVLIID